jgi:hypothetical protein
MPKPKPQPETVAGAVPVTLIRVSRGYLMSWRRPIPQCLIVPTETIARALAERIAAGENPFNAITKILTKRNGAKAAKASWAHQTPAERRARAQANARARWARVKGTPSAQLAADASQDGDA